MYFDQNVILINHKRTKDVEKTLKSKYFTINKFQVHVV